MMWATRRRISRGLAQIRIRKKLSCTEPNRGKWFSYADAIPPNTLFRWLHAGFDPRLPAAWCRGNQAAAQAIFSSQIFSRKPGTTDQQDGIDRSDLA